jgi:hypothetical protein
MDHKAVHSPLSPELAPGLEEYSGAPPVVDHVGREYIPHTNHDIESGHSTDEKHHIKETGVSPEITEASMDDHADRPLTGEEKRSAFARKYKPFILVFIWMVMTGCVAPISNRESTLDG